jgi:predicted NAD-dependent protein-ADP-ribosyltransferase YbiA (DUF1768 family)
MIFSPKLFSFLTILVFTGCLHAQTSDLTSGADGFPDIWWQAVPGLQLPGWEIPPQSADRSKGEVVLSKRNELGQFSNLGPASFVLDGNMYGSVEGLWQGMKYPENETDTRNVAGVSWAYTRAQVMAMKGFEAKHAGDLANANMKQLGIKWVTYQGEKIIYNGADSEKHYQLILRACRAKLDQNPELKKLLLSTKNLTFFPDHRQAPDSLPAYKYHEIYLKLRTELQNAH